MSLECDHLTRRYGALVAVDDLSLTVPSGTILGFLGPNGAGKTTTMRMMAGLLRPSAGAVRVCGYDVQRHPLEIRRRLVFLPDEPALPEKLTANEWLEFVGAACHLRLGARATELLEIFDLARAARQQIGGYSHGMRQRLSWVVALLRQPDVLLLDEPTVGLDPPAARLVTDALRVLTRQGTAVLLSTHVLEIADALCDHVAILQGGRIRAEGTLADLRSEHQSLESLFFELTGGPGEAELLAALRQ